MRLSQPRQRAQFCSYWTRQHRLTYTNSDPDQNVSRGLYACVVKMMAIVRTDVSSTCASKKTLPVSPDKREGCPQKEDSTAGSRHRQIRSVVSLAGTA